MGRLRKPQVRIIFTGGSHNGRPIKISFRGWLSENENSTKIRQKIVTYSYNF